MTEPNPNTPPQGNPQEPPKDEAKFTQADLDKIVQKRLDEQKAETEKQAELAKMSEIDRLKAEKEDLESKYQAEADKNALSTQKEELRKYMSEKQLILLFLAS